MTLSRLVRSCRYGWTPPKIYSVGQSHKTHMNSTSWLLRQSIIIDRDSHFNMSFAVHYDSPSSTIVSWALLRIGRVSGLALAFKCEECFLPQATFSEDTHLWPSCHPVISWQDFAYLDYSFILFAQVEAFWEWMWSFSLKPPLRIHSSWAYHCYHRSCRNILWTTWLVITWARQQMRMLCSSTGACKTFLCCCRLSKDSRTSNYTGPSSSSRLSRFHGERRAVSQSFCLGSCN